VRIASGDTGRVIYFVAVDATDKDTRETGLTGFTVYRERDGGTLTLMTTPTTTESHATNAPGVYALLCDEDTTLAATSDSEEMVFHITHASMAPVTRTIELYRRAVTANRTIAIAADGSVDTVTTLTGLTSTTYAEPGQGAPAATTTLEEKIGYIYKTLRNKKEATAAGIFIYDDAGTTVDQKRTISDDDTTYTEEELISGP